jgi:hypothetical protein
MIRKIKKRVNHWSFQYIKNRICLAIWQKNNPKSPWLVKDAISYLDAWLCRSDVGVEWGSGRSTVWLAKRISKLISIEHDEKWFVHVKDSLKNFKNVEQIIEPLIDSSLSRNYSSKIPEKLANESIDFCLVDGRLRDYCTLHILDKIKPGGLLIIDNIERYIPIKRINKKTPYFVDKCSSEIWSIVLNEIKDWRVVFYSNGVWVTAIWTKPSR